MGVTVRKKGETCYVFITHQGAAEGEGGRRQEGR
jgi:hypothetical protein